MMPLPQPEHVAACAARTWSPAYTQHALLWLSGIVSSLRNAAAFDSIHATRYGGRATELEITVGDLARVMREHPVDVPGAALSLTLCTLLACESESQLAEVLAVPLSIVLAGRARMYALAERLVAVGRADASLEAIGSAASPSGGGVAIAGPSLRPAGG